MLSSFFVANISFPLRDYCWQNTHLPLAEAYSKTKMQWREKLWKDFVSSTGELPTGFPAEPLGATSPEIPKRNQIGYISYFDEGYPALLRKIPYAPWGLFVKGTWPEFGAFGNSVSIVGTRKANAYGKAALKQILSKVNDPGVEGNLCIFAPCALTVSGLAYGIDACAHEVSLAAGIPTLAILGHGLNAPLHPRTHLALANKIIEKGGALVSEFPLEMGAYRSHFPWRNRIIAGLTPLTWVVQGTHKSGTRHTVKHALDQGRQVAVTPGDIFSELSEIPHEFLREGAHPITCASDLRELLL